MNAFFFLFQATDAGHLARYIAVQVCYLQYIEQAHSNPQICPIHRFCRICVDIDVDSYEPGVMLRLAAID